MGTTVPLVLLAALVPPSVHGDVSTDGLLIGCYRYIPGDCSGVYRVLPPIEPLRGGRLDRVVAGTRPVWSPDRTRFAYITNDVLWVTGSDGYVHGGGIGVPLDGSAGAISWSPDGRYILYTWASYEARGVRHGIGRVAADLIGRGNWGGGEQLLLPGRQGARWPAVSPDGRHLAWSGTADDGTSDSEAATICWALWEDLRWSARGPTPRPMLERTISRAPGAGPYRHQRPHWSPDSKRIGFDTLDSRTGLRTAWVADLEADSADEITIGAEHSRSASESASVFFLGWLGDDDCLAGSGGFLPSRAYRVSLSEESFSRVFNASTAIWDVAIGPDRQRVAFIAGGTSSPPGTCHAASLNTDVIVWELQTGELRTVASNADPAEGDIRDRPLVPYSLSW